MALNQYREPLKCKSMQPKCNCVVQVAYTLTAWCLATKLKWEIVFSLCWFDQRWEKASVTITGCDQRSRNIDFTAMVVGILLISGIRISNIMHRKKPLFPNQPRGNKNRCAAPKVWVAQEWASPRLEKSQKCLLRFTPAMRALRVEIPLAGARTPRPCL